MADDGAADLDDLERWAAEARAREAADARVRERWLRTQAEEGARLVHVLAGLAEQRATVGVTTLAGRHVTGRLTAVGQDFVALVVSGRTTLVALAAVAAVRPGPGERRRRTPAVGVLPDDEDGDRTESAVALADLLAQAVAERPRVAVQAGLVSVTGTLRAVGLDVVVLDTPGDRVGLAYLPVTSIYEISFLDSG